MLPGVRTKNLRDEVKRLAPWHHRVQVTKEVSTEDAQDVAYPEECGSISFLDVWAQYDDLFWSLYPNGLEGRAVLDCGCNCGAFLFFARDHGAGHCYGFDAREFWINQGRLIIRESTVRNTEEIELEVHNLYDLPNRAVGPFDVTAFNGLFYHLPDPITGLKIAADLTRELIIVNTTVRTGKPDGMMELEEESTELPLSGTHGLTWLPTGPLVLDRILRWLGFIETKIRYYDPDVVPALKRGRIEILGARSPGFLSRI